MFAIPARLRSFWDASRRPGWRGWCPVCEAPARFVAFGDWFRDDLRCSGCASIPRERALMRAIDAVRPDWRDGAIHESSPRIGGLSAKLRRECPGYLESQFDTETPHGALTSRSYRSENLERQTFADETFDLVITQDVFEHLFDPEAAIREIARTLKPGGVYLMTVPLVNKARPTAWRASLQEGEVVHHAPPQHHGSPIDPDGSLVTVDWGYDIAQVLEQASGMATTIECLEDHRQGIEAEYLDVVICRKAA